MGVAHQASVLQVPWSDEGHQVAHESSAVGGSAIVRRDHLQEPLPQTPRPT